MVSGFHVIYQCYTYDQNKCYGPADTMLFIFYKNLVSILWLITAKALCLEMPKHYEESIDKGFITGLRFHKGIREEKLVVGERGIIW